jgi:hypothetical protein
MNIRTPNISNKDKQVILNILNEEINPLNVGRFIVLYDTDGLQNSIQNTQNWLAENFGSLILK